MSNIYKLHGLSKTIVSDRDKVFLSNFWKSLFKILKVNLQMSSAYHPQSDGQTEVVNRCLECHLRCMAGDKPKEWATWLPMAEYWYYTNFHIAIGTSPFEVVYGQKPPLYIPYVTGTRPNEDEDRSMTKREEVMQQLKFQLQRAQTRMSNIANKHRTNREFNVGAFVYLKL